MSAARGLVRLVRGTTGVVAAVAIGGLVAAAPSMASTTVPMHGIDCMTVQTPIVESTKADLTAGSAPTSCR